MNYKTWGFLLIFASAVAFASIYIVPADSSGLSNRAWAHGVGYVLPRLLAANLFAFFSMAVLGAGNHRRGRRAASKLFWSLAIALLLPALCVIAFFIRIIFLV
jgi:hypothetical protein